ncbi:cell division protein FtsA [Candidatus Dependentiae bacterium]|nr:cell division protein FtsA [Candidatus Dependentiae bacterium]
MFADRLIVSIDVGTTKICVLVGQQIDHDHVEIIGIGKSPSDGLKKGVVVDIARTVHSIKKAVKEAEITSGCTIESAYIGISGGHIQSMNSHGMVPIKGGSVRPIDITNALDAAKAISIPEGHYLLHVLPQYFIIDGSERVHDPLGMHGLRLEVQAHLITGAIASAQNLIKCCEMAGITVLDIILEQLASASAVLSEDERELGVGVLDIGGGTSDFALYQHGTIRHTMVLPVAGNHFTNDIAVGLRTTLKDAERVKLEHGCAYTPLLEAATIEVELVQGTGNQRVSSKDLLCIIEPRAVELLTLIHEDITAKALLPMMRSGLVLTGGGALLKGIPELACALFSLPVRVGFPRPEYGIIDTLNNPIYATGYGLLLQGIKKRTNHIDAWSGPTVKRVLMRMKSWIADFF